MTETFIIDPLAPIALLDVTDTLDNEYWRWCSDDPLADVSTFDEHDIGPAYIIPAGTTVKMPYLWGYGRTGLTTPMDYQVTLPKSATAERVVYVVLSAYYASMDEADAGGRFFFIENVRVNDDGVVEIVWGT